MEVGRSSWEGRWRFLLFGGRCVENGWEFVCERGDCFERTQVGGRVSEGSAKREKNSELRGREETACREILLDVGDVRGVKKGN